MQQPTGPNNLELDQLRQLANDLISQQKLDEAEKTCQQILRLSPKQPDGWVLRARIAQRQNNFDAAAIHATKAQLLAPTRLDVALVAAESLIYVGQIAKSLAALSKIEQRAAKHVDVWKQLSALYTQLGRHNRAYNCAEKALLISPQSLNLKFLVASAAMAIGKIQQSQAYLNDLICQLPQEGDLYYNRATANKQTQSHNHVHELKSRLDQTNANHNSYTPLSYALGKELEDIGRDDEAFIAYAQGAASRQKRLSYQVQVDIDAINHLVEIFDKEWWKNTKDGDPVDGPIFILGLPRSGSTLIERIVSAHSQVSSLGEINDFAYGVVRAGHPAATKQQLMQKSASSDMWQLGQCFWRACSGYGENSRYLIDKTPANFLYLGLIAKALPNAKIIHTHRHPMASGYAMFKTLFRMGYPFSYDLKEIGQYMVAYHHLMEHWRKLFADRILDVSYEALVDNQEQISKKTINHCGLSWQDSCLDFHKNKAPTATASAAQVRQPIYRQARDIWRKHENALQPLRQILEAGGISCE